MMVWQFYGKNEVGIDYWENSVSVKGYTFTVVDLELRFKGSDIIQIGPNVWLVMEMHTIYRVIDV